MTPTPETFNDPEDPMVVFAKSVPALTVLAYTAELTETTPTFKVVAILAYVSTFNVPPFKCVLAVIILPSTVPTTLAEPAFRYPLAVIVSPNTNVTADKVPTLPVLACIRPYTLAEPAFS